jgi:hypothetical protein
MFRPAFPDTETGNAERAVLVSLNRSAPHVSASLLKAKPQTLISGERGSAMPSVALRILVIGEFLPGTGDVLRRLSDRGWGARNVATLQDARHLLGTFDFDVVLASESLPDGRGYDIAAAVASHSRTLLVGVALSESCLWLPVVERGRYVLGKRGLNLQALESEMETLLASQARSFARETVREMVGKPSFMPERPGPQRATHARRKYRDRVVAPL